MKVIHIIPAAFEYFNELKNNLLDLVNNEQKLGIQSEAFTIQFGNYFKKTDKKNSKKLSKNNNLVRSGVFNTNLILEELKNYDVIHLHLPILGFLKELIFWKKTFPEKKLVVSIWYKFKIIDTFSSFIYFYNKFFTKKILFLADIILCKDKKQFTKLSHKNKINSNKIFLLSDVIKQVKNIHLTNKDNSLKLIKTKQEALVNIYTYNNLLK